MQSRASSSRFPDGSASVQRSCVFPQGAMLMGSQTVEGTEGGGGVLGSFPVRGLRYYGFAAFGFLNKSPCAGFKPVLAESPHGFGCSSAAHAPKQPDPESLDTQM